MRQLKITKQVTNRDAESLDKYLHEIGKINLLTPEEEIKYARQIRLGVKPEATQSEKIAEKIALKKLVESNLRFVVSVAKQYQNQGLSLCDLINEGNVGLIKAAFRFDETKGFKFISYAVWWIRQCILQAIAEQSRPVRQPTNKQGLNSKVHKAIAKLEQELHRSPYIGEIADFLNMFEKDVEESLKNSVRHISMDAPLIEGEDSNLYDVIKYDESPSPDINLEKESLCQEIERALNTLNERERLVIKLYFGLCGCTPMTLEEIGIVANLTRERVRQIQNNALKRLKNQSRSKNLLNYLR
ncbi:MAG: RNA polymerase sigma factor RpoD/SigA [Candidatus Bostrichicola ureolyticus]|nr:MAG: RNA polymerase sigma factor RpoD/SigA [Candidatus Bostrichicola ureolyticus]